MLTLYAVRVGILSMFWVLSSPEATLGFRKDHRAMLSERLVEYGAAEAVLGDNRCWWPLLVGTSVIESLLSRINTAIGILVPDARSASAWEEMVEMALGPHHWVFDREDTA